MVNSTVKTLCERFDQDSGAHKVGLFLSQYGPNNIILKYQLIMKNNKVQNKRVNINVSPSFHFGTFL